MEIVKPTLESLVPELREIVLREGMDPTQLHLLMPVDANSHLAPLEKRNLVLFTDRLGQKVGRWETPSLRALFRGDRIPPDLEQYPPSYVSQFYEIEFWVANIFDLSRPRADREMEEIYSTLRRRPDGKSLGEMHDWVWRIAAFFLGRFVISEAESTAIFQRLARSCGAFAISHVSYNYADYIKPMLGGGGPGKR